MTKGKAFQFIVVGSGPSAVMAAQTLVEAGKEVAMVDVGFQDTQYHQFAKDKTFEEARLQDSQQHRYLLGDKLEAIPWDEIKVGAQLSPARKVMVKEVSKLIPLQSNNFIPMESLAYGGLGAGWGLGSYVYSDNELKKCGINPSEIADSYQKVADRIGISADDDDIRPYVLGDLKNIQGPLKMDLSFQKISAKYSSKRKKLNKKGIYYGAAAMALLSEDLGTRKACSYKDMDFYNDHEKSAYRAQFTVDELKKQSNFSYIPHHLVTSFKDQDQGVEVNCIDTASNNPVSLQCQKLVLTAGALGNARIVLRSFESLKQLPILCNPYTYMPALQPRMLGKKLGTKTSMAQAMMMYDPDGSHSDLTSVALFSYNSLLLFKLVKEAPLNIADSRWIMQYLQSAFVIAGIHHPDEMNGKKHLSLIEDSSTYTNDKLHVDFEQNADLNKYINAREKVIRGALRSLGVYPISRMAPENGGSIHYAGSVPFHSEEKIGTTASDGRLHQTQNVYVADSSSFTYLPAKGITFSLMANADRVSKNLL
jgi:hypothetical protein